MSVSAMSLAEASIDQVAVLDRADAALRGAVMASGV